MEGFTPTEDEQFLDLNNAGFTPKDERIQERLRVLHRLILHRYQEGDTLAQTANTLKVSPSTIWGYLDSQGINLKAPDDPTWDGPLYG